MKRLDLKQRTWKKKYDNKGDPKEKEISPERETQRGNELVPTVTSTVKYVRVVPDKINGTKVHSHGRRENLVIQNVER